MFDIMEWYTKHAKKLDKKYYAKGESIYVLHRRTLQTAKSIIDLINDIPADDLFLELYMLVKDKEFGSFVGRYQYVLEIAKEKPDTFTEQLYEFYLKRAEILYYASRGTESMEELSRITGIHRDSVKRTLDGYHAEGIEYIYRCARGKRRNHLDEKAEEVKALVRNRRPETVSVFLAMIAEELDIHLTETPARRWLKKMGFVTLKQEEFRKKQT